MQQAVVPVILCGGAGARLWPLSTADKPKPFHALAGAGSLYQQALHRAAAAPFTARPVVVARARNAGLAQAQAAAVGIAIECVLEETGHDTLVAALLGAQAAVGQHGACTLVLLASDQHIPDGEAFGNCIRIGLPAATEGALVVLGIRPRGPDSSYGYIIPKGAGRGGEGAVVPVHRFVEKPDPAVAEQLVAEGALWNSGNFIVTADTLLAAAGRQAPALLAAAQEGHGGRRPEPGGHLVSVPLRPGEGVSIDRALAETYHDVRMVRAGFDWSDVGTWDEVSRLAATPGAFVHSGGLPVRVIGLGPHADGLIVVATPDGVLVTRKDQSALLKSQARDLA